MELYASSYTQRFALRQNPGSSADGIIAGEDIVVVEALAWDYNWGRRPQIFSRLSKSNRILFVEIPDTIYSALKNRRWSLFFRWLKGPVKKNHNLCVYTPPPLLPLALKYSFVNKLNHILLTFLNKQLLKRLDFKNPLLWICLPTGVEQIGKLNERLIIYDCFDEHSAWDGRIDKNYILSMESRLCRKADVVFATTPTLLDKVKRYNPNAHLVPNAADIAHFAKAFSEETIVPEEMRHIKSPIIAFVGVVGSYWVDLNLIKYAASTYPEWSFVLIGPIASDVSCLRGHKNIYLLGKREYKDLPGYLKRADVCILPFIVNDLIKHTNPIKLYEYLAAGKPVVSTPAPEVLAFKGTVRIAKDKNEFVQQLKEAVEDKDETARRNRIEVAMRNSWDIRLNKISQEVAGALKAKA